MLRDFQIIIDYSNCLILHFARFFRQNPQKPQLLTVGDYAGLKAAGFNDSIPTKLLIHGFASGVNKTMIRTLKEGRFQTSTVRREEEFLGYLTNDSCLF